MAERRFQSSQAFQRCGGEKDIGKLSPLHQTYELEVFHCAVNTFAPKSTHFFYPAMLARLSVAALHFNENGHRNQAVTKTGELQWHISYPKGKKENMLL